MATPQHAATATSPTLGSTHNDPNPLPAAIAALVIGLGMLIVAFANLNRLAGWADDYGTVLVYLAFFLVMSIAGRLFWWGTDTVIGAFRNRD